MVLVPMLACCQYQYVEFLPDIIENDYKALWEIQIYKNIMKNVTSSCVTVVTARYIRSLRWFA